MSRHRTPDQLRLPLQRDLPSGGLLFVVSACNQAAAETLATWLPSGGGVMALCGPAGSGKSRLAQAWTERVGGVALHGAEAALADPMTLEGRPVMLDRAQDADDETLFHLINLAHSGGGALLLVSRPAPMAWTVALPDLRSRLDAIVTTALEAPDDTVLTAILETRFAERSIVPAADVIPYLLARIDRSADAVERVVDRLDALHKPVTRALARLVLDARTESGDLLLDDSFQD